MKRSILFLLSAITLLAFQSAYAQQYIVPQWGYGGELGGSRGDNGGDNEQWRPRIRIHLQMKLLPQLSTQLGLAYTELQAKNTYETETFEVDYRFLYGPFQMQRMFPYIYAGLGFAKNLKVSGSGFLPVIPFGIGIQTAIGDQVSLSAGAGYNLVFSDRLDDLTRGSNNLNSITNGRHDGFFSFMLGLIYSGSKQSDDPDEDGLSTTREKQLGTHPKKADTDGDGLKDGDEVTKYMTDPLMADTDSDSLSDGEEVNKYNTHVLQADSDSDELSDGLEVNTYHSDPMKNDSDLDGILDGKEVNQLHTDPILSDTDGDELNDGDEVNRYRSDPLKADTDLDGLKDGQEDHHHTDPLKMDSDGDGLTDGDEVHNFKTDPSKADTDGDALDDASEFNTHHTNALKVDTDEGGMMDGSEIKAGKNPLDPKDDVFELVKGKKIVLRGINFDTNKSDVLPASVWILEKARASMLAYPAVTVVIEGHTDNVGSDEANRTLSQKRAQSVKDWLVAKGIPASRMKVVGKGETEPMSTNDTEAGRADNRRMEFAVE